MRAASSSRGFDARTWSLSTRNAICAVGVSVNILPFDNKQLYGHRPPCMLYFSTTCNHVSGEPFNYIVVCSILWVSTYHSTWDKSEVRLLARLPIFRWMTTTFQYKNLSVPHFHMSHSHPSIWRHGMLSGVHALSCVHNNHARNSKDGIYISLIEWCPLFKQG